MVLNTFSYHLTPGGFIFDASARALGCAVIPAGPGNTEAQFELIEAYRPVGYSGTPDFLKILLDAAASSRRDVSSIKRALVSGAAFPKSLQDEVKARGVDAYQAFGTADLGMIAFETPARDGMTVNEDLIMEIVRPGTGDPVAPGDVGEIVVTSLDPQHPWISLALGDLTAALPGASPCGRTNMRIKGWMGRADQTTKVKGMFVRPEQIAEIGKRHPELGRLRLVVTRSGEADLMTLKAEAATPGEAASERTISDAARSDKARRQCRTGRRCLAAERRQGDFRRAVGAQNQNRENNPMHRRAACEDRCFNTAKSEQPWNARHDGECTPILGRCRLLRPFDPVVVPRHQIVDGPDLLAEIGAIAAQIGKQVGDVGRVEVAALHQAR